MTKRKSSAPTPVTLTIDPVAMLASHVADRQSWADGGFAGLMDSVFGAGFSAPLLELTRRKLSAAKHDLSHGRLPAHIAAVNIEYRAADFRGLGGDPDAVGDDWVRAFHPQRCWTTVPASEATWNEADERYESEWDDPDLNAGPTRGVVANAPTQMP